VSSLRGWVRNVRDPAVADESHGVTTRLEPADTGPAHAHNSPRAKHRCAGNRCRQPI